MSPGRMPKWECELWSYVCSGDGECCPRLGYCQTKRADCMVADDNMERVKRLLEKRTFKLSDYDFIKPMPKCRIGRLVERLAQKWLKRAPVHSLPVPTELALLADGHHPIEVRLLPLKVYHGAIWRLREGWVIQLKKNDTPARRRYTLFHETFHILAHCNISAVVFRKSKAIHGSFNELVADHFASCVLMPREWVNRKWVEVNDIDKMAEIFVVPKQAMCVSLKRLGLL